jgi:hypothetical protein
MAEESGRATLKFSKKAENVGANFRIFVSKKGFTAQALKTAKHEHVDCLSLLPEDPKTTGFGVGNYWYGTVVSWNNVRVMIVPRPGERPLPKDFDAHSVKFRGKKAITWISKKLTERRDDYRTSDLVWQLPFSQPQTFEVAGQSFELIAIVFTVACVCRYRKNG